jgi:putative endonuclease
MAGLVPAIPLRDARRMREYYVYFLASRPGGAIYVGVTNDLVRRIYEHKQGFVKGHTKRYGIDRLVYSKSTRTFNLLCSERRTSSIGHALGKPT